MVRWQEGIAAGVAGLSILGMLVTRNPNMFIGWIVVGAIGVGFYLISVLMRIHGDRAWRQALRGGRWQAVTRDTPAGTDFYVERIAEYRDRRQLLGEQYIESIPRNDGRDPGVWEAWYAEAWGRAENRAVVRNAELRREDTR